MQSILGISSFYHDSAAALIVDGKIVAAAQEERFTRIKHDASFPFRSIEFVLKYGNIDLSKVDHVAFYEKPFLKFERLLETYVAHSPKGFGQFLKSMPIWLREKLFQKRILTQNLKKFDKNFDEKKILFSEHHLSHAASAFYPSPFEKAVVLTADGVGEWATTTVAIGQGKKLEIKKEIHYPHSLGLLYSAFTYYTGFKVNSGEYKLMGLAPYGKPKYKKIIEENLVDTKQDGSFWLDQRFFNYSTDFTMINSKFEKLFGKKRRVPEKDKIEQFHMDIAASIQSFTEEIMLKLSRAIRDEFAIENLCLAGGVALNCVANGKILKEKIFKNIWVQPAAGDAGGALGAALSVWHLHLNKDREQSNYDDDMLGSYLGPNYKQDEIEQSLKNIKANFEVYNQENLIEKTAVAISNGKAVGWFQGRMEFGPRALGNRSILGDPRDPNMQKNLNLKVKFRESFRPFAPSILENECRNWFELETKSPYMLMVSNVKKDKTIEPTDEEQNLFGIEKLNVKRSSIPAVTHVDYSARIQTVNQFTNKLYFNLLSKFKDITGCPILINTSFNVRGEPIVNTPEEAFKCFMGNNLDILVIGNCYLEKKNQNKDLIKSYFNEFKLD